MSGMNSATVVGNIGKDPEIQSTAGGRIARLTIGTAQTWTDKESGKRREKTEWHRIVVFNDALAGFIEKNVKKGSKVGVIGSLATRKFIDKDRIERYITEIIVDHLSGSIHLLGDPVRRDEPERVGGSNQLRLPAREPAAGGGGSAKHDGTGQSTELGE